MSSYLFIVKSELPLVIQAFLGHTFSSGWVHDKNVWNSNQNPAMLVVQPLTASGLLPSFVFMLLCHILSTGTVSADHCSWHLHTSQIHQPDHLGAGAETGHQPNLELHMAILHACRDLSAAQHGTILPSTGRLSVLHQWCLALKCSLSWWRVFPRFQTLNVKMWTI